MSDGFTQMFDRAQTFYAQLEDNNSKVWFEPRKSTFKTDIEGPARLFAEIMAEEISRVTGAGHVAKVFRIYRDVRFSKDKAPLKTQLSMMWSTGDKDDPAPLFYFAIGPHDAFLACGVPGFAGDDLRRFRAMVDTWGDRLTEIIADTGAGISSFGPEPLKRVPKPYDPDHTHADLLRRKSLAISLPLVDGWRGTGDGLVAVLTDRVEALAPFRAFMATRL